MIDAAEREGKKNSKTIIDMITRKLLLKGANKRNIHGYTGVFDSLLISKINRVTLERTSLVYPASSKLRFIISNNTSSSLIIRI